MCLRMYDENGILAIKLESFVKYQYMGLLIFQTFVCNTQAIIYVLLV